MQIVHASIWLFLFLLLAESNYRVNRNQQLFFIPRHNYPFHAVPNYWKANFNIYFPSIPRSFKRFLFFSGFWSKLYPCMSHVPPTTSFLIYRLITLGGDWVLRNSVSCSFLHLLLLAVVQIFSWTSRFRTPSAYVLPIMRETTPCSNLGQDTDYTDLDFFFVFSQSFPSSSEEFFLIRPRLLISTSCLIHHSVFCYSMLQAVVWLAGKVVK